MLLISVLLAGILNMMLVAVSGTDAVAVYTAGWRVVMIAMVPIIAIGTALVTVAGAAIGAKRYRDLSVSYHYASKVGIGVAVLTALLTFVFAPEISVIFTYSPETASLAPSITAFLRGNVSFLYLHAARVHGSIHVPGGGRGMTSLFITLLRELVSLSASHTCSHLSRLGEQAMVGIVAGDIAGSLVGYLWGWAYIRRLGEGDAGTRRESDLGVTGAVFRIRQDSTPSRQ